MKRKYKKNKSTDWFPVDNFSTHRKYAKGFVSVRLDDPDKMRDYETIRGYISDNNLEYITNKIRHSAIKVSADYGKERDVLKSIFLKKLSKFRTIPQAMATGAAMLSLGLAVRFLRGLSIIMPWDRRKPKKSIITEDSGYIMFEGKDYYDINFKDTWRPSIISRSGESLKAHIKSRPAESDIRVGFALLENADPEIFNGDYAVHVKYTLASKRQKRDASFLIPINNETDDIEYNSHSLWFDFKIDINEFSGEDIDFTLEAAYGPVGNKKISGKSYNEPAIAWGSPRVLTNKRAKSTKKILVLSLETMTDPYFIAENYGVSKNGMFTFLEGSEWKTFKRSYSQSDGTLGAAGCFSTGLTSLQHGLFDYGLPYYTNHSKAWSPEIRTLAEMLKSKKFSTHSMGLKAFSGYAGCARGFDSHFSCYSLHGIDCADFDLLYQCWDGVVNNDALILMHFDRLHKPYAKCTRRINRVYPTEEITGKYNALEKYVRQMRQLDTEIRRIMNFLKLTKQYDNTAIIITGDHGGAYAWQKRQAYDLYEDRTRVPLWIKGTNWTDLGNMDTGKCVNSTIFPYLNILKWMNIPLPEYFKNLAQVSPEFDGVAISETATHPTERDYVLSLTDRDHKYVRFMKVDWIQNVIIEKGKEFLQPYAYASTDYGLDKDCSHEEPDKFRKMKKLADTHIESSFEFRRLYGGLR